MYVSLSADLDISVNVRWTVGTYLLRTYTCRYCRLLLGLVFVCEVCVTGVVVACSVFILLLDRTQQHHTRRRRWRRRGGETACDNGSGGGSVQRQRVETA